MKNLILTTLITLLFVTGCAQVTVVEKSAQTIVKFYCKAPEEVRLANRAIINTAISPNSIAVTCVK